MERSRKVARRLNDGVGFLMKKNKVDVIWGEATLEAAGKIAVEGVEDARRPRARWGPAAYQAKHIIVATGARPRVLPGIEPDKKLVWTYFEAMVPERVPKSLLVIGSGAIGIEFASFYRTLGRGGDGGGGAAADPARRGCRDRRLRAQGASRSRA